MSARGKLYRGLCAGMPPRGYLRRQRFEPKLLNSQNESWLKMCCFGSAVVKKKEQMPIEAVTTAHHELNEDTFSSTLQTGRFEV